MGTEHIGGSVPSALGQAMFFYDPPDCLENLGAKRAENSSKPGTGRFKKSIAGAELQPIKVSTRRRLQPLKRLSWLPRNGGYNEKRHAEACPTQECAPQNRPARTCRRRRRLAMAILLPPAPTVAERTFKSARGTEQHARFCRRFLTERRADRPKAHADSADRRSLAVPSETRRESEEGSRPLLDCPSRARRRPAGARWRRARSPTATPWAATGRQEGRAAAPGDSSPECPHAAAA